MKKPSFQRKTAQRIAAVSLALAGVVTPVGWYMAKENAEDAVVALATEESQHLLQKHALAFSGDARTSPAAAAEAARAITGGLFDIAELYDRTGQKLSEATTPRGALLESQIPSHGQPRYSQPFYESIHLPNDQWALRIFVPVRTSPNGQNADVMGYFEGVRIVPQWQKDQIRTDALTMAALVALAALLCGGFIYPVVVYLAKENHQKAQALLRSHIATMEALGRAIAKRDSDTGAHNYRVAWIATRIAEAMHFSTEAMQALILGSFLHDIGKIGIPDAILLKPGKLTDDEFVTMRTHVLQGEDIIQNIAALQQANAVISGHHEKWNGSGYPRGLQGEDIPLAARIFAVADVFDALCSKRPYKSPMGYDDVMAILTKDTGTHFDPGVMQVFAPMSRAIYDHLSHCSEQDCKALLEAKLQEYFYQIF